MRLLWLAVLVLPFILQGCGVKTVALLPETEGSVLQLRWKFFLPELYDLPADVRLIPVVKDEIIYLVGGERVTAMALDTGKVIWSVQVPLVSSGATLWEDDLFFSTREGEIVAFDLDEREIRWRTDIGGEVIAPVALSPSLLAARTVSGTVIALNPEDGERLWSWQGDEPSLTLRGTSMPIISLAGSAVIVLTDNCRLAALDLTDGSANLNEQLNTASGVTDLDRLIDGDGTPHLNRSMIYGSCYNGQFRAFNLVSGNTEWSAPPSSIRDIVAQDQNIFVVDTESKIQAFKSQGGQLEWVQDSLEGRSLSHPVLWDNRLVVGDHGGYVHVFSTASGALLGRARPLCARPQDARGESSVCSPTRALASSSQGMVAVSDDGWVVLLNDSK